MFLLPAFWDSSLCLIIEEIFLGTTFATSSPPSLDVWNVSNTDKIRFWTVFFQYSYCLEQVRVTVIIQRRGSSIWYIWKTFQKTNISYTLIQIFLAYLVCGSSNACREHFQPFCQRKDEIGVFRTESQNKQT